jgi:hypothetical protein
MQEHHFLINIGKGCATVDFAFFTGASISTPPVVLSQCKIPKKKWYHTMC